MDVAVELAAGIAFWLLFLRFGAGPRLLLYSLYTCFLIVVFLIDWQHRLILNRVTYPGIVLAAFLTSVVTPIGWRMTLAGVVLAGLLFGGLYLLGHLLFHQEALGLGDVKLSMLLGAMAGFPAVVWWLLLGSLFGAVGGLAMVAARRNSLRSFMPYGTAMCLGAFVAFFIDPTVVLL
jgi:leader peptidase (prepilin peptidase)/N-methyltransferase